MSLYDTLQYYEKAVRKTFRVPRKVLEEKLRTRQEGVRLLPQIVQGFVIDLRQIDDFYRREGRLIQRHRLEDFWDREKIEIFNKLRKDMVGDVYPLMDALESSIVQNNQGNVYLTPTWIISLACTPHTGALLYWVGENIESENLMVLGFSTFAAGISLGLLGLFNYTIRNPFEKLASELERRMEYILANYKDGRSSPTK